MRIAVWHNLPSGGGQRALYDHVRGLVQSGHEVEIFSPPTADRKMLDINALAPYHEVPLRPARLSRADVPAWLRRAVPELPLAAKLRGQADKLGVDFTLHVALTHGEMLEVLAEASLLTYAPRLEPFGYAPLECGAAGIPTVAIAEGGVRETVVDGVNGLLVRRDPKEMGSAIRALLEDEPLRGCLGEGAKKVVAERWSLEAATRCLETELSRAVG